MWGECCWPWGWQDLQDVGLGCSTGSLQLTGRTAPSAIAGEPGAGLALPWKCRRQFWWL